MSEDKSELSLSELQLSLMRVLWQRGQASTAEVAEALRAEGRPLAHTTVATLLQRLEKRGLLACDREARALVYRPCVSEPEVQKNTRAPAIGVSPTSASASSSAGPLVNCFTPNQMPPMTMSRPAARAP